MPVPKLVGRPRGKNLTKEQTVEAKAAFLKEFAQHGIVTPALEAANVSYPTYMRWQEHDEEFNVAYGLARKAADDVIRAEIKRRAIQGVEKPVFYQGEIVGRVREYSDNLLMFLSKSRMPEFREKQQIEHTGTVTFIDLVRSAEAQLVSTDDAPS